MKKIKLVAIVLAAAFFTNCTKENNDITNTSYSGVPSGEIVPVEERSKVLTGSSELLKSSNLTLIYWSFKSSKAIVSGCSDAGTYDILEEVDEDLPQVAFSPDGTFYAKSNNVSEINVGTWVWADENKTGIILSSYGDVVFTFTALNENQVVYASNQNAEGCSVITYEELYK